MRSDVRRVLQCLLLPLVVLTMPACVSTGVRSSGSALPQAATTFGDGQLNVEIDHNCGARCESFTAKFENLTTTPIEIVVGQARLKRGAERFVVRRQGEEKGNVLVPPRSKVSAKFSPYSSASGRRLSYVVPQAVWCSAKIDPQCKKTLEADAQCAGYARGYFTVHKEAEGWVILTFAYRIGDRVELVQSPAPDTTLFSGPVDVPKQDDRAPAFFREPDDVVFFKMECNDKCRCKNLTKPRSNSDDGFKPVIEPVP